MKWRTPPVKIQVVKEFEFEAAHYLPGYEGACSRTHGHTYKLQIGITDEIDPKTGMVLDFSVLKEIVQKNIIDYLDHEFLNEVYAEHFPRHDPTAENMVVWIAATLQNKYPNLSLVRLYETSTSYAEWTY